MPGTGRRTGFGEIPVISGNDAADLAYSAHSDEAELARVNEPCLDHRSLGHVRRFLDRTCGLGIVCEMLRARSSEANLLVIVCDPAHVGLERFPISQGHIRAS